jgi:hypothetical protein
MKKYLMVTIVTLICTAGLYAQTTAPKGFVNGSIVLAGSIIPITGFIKTGMCEDGRLVFIAAGTELPKKYMATELLAVDAGDLHFIAIGGDFFKTITDGPLCFVQKTSNRSNNTVYNGSEAIFVKGTEGRVDDYFFYTPSSKQLTLITKKNREVLAADTFAGCADAITKAAETGNDLAGLSRAVDIYNQSKQISAK